jgi:hypothetical protein
MVQLTKKNQSKNTKKNQSKNTKKNQSKNTKKNQSKNTKKNQSKNTKKNQSWFSQLFSSKSNNIPLSKKKDIANKWCKKQKLLDDEGGGVCVGERGDPLINYRFRLKFGLNSIKYNKSSKCNKKWGQGRRRSGCSPKIDYTKMKV